jgi:hypothetical protein
MRRHLRTPAPNNLSSTKRGLRWPSPAMVVACLALFVALSGSAMAAFVVSSNSQIAPNTIYGSNKPASANDNIVDGSINGADITSKGIPGGRITDKSLTAADLAPDTLTGAQINEGTLARVPDSAALGGIAASDYGQYDHSTFVAASDCAQVSVWTGCAPISVNVPSGHVYLITVTSTVNVFSSQTQTLGFCAAGAGPSCLYFNSAPDLLTAWGGAYSVGTSSASQYVGGPQTFTAQTAIKLASALNATPNAKITTTVSFYDVSTEHP